LLNASVGVERVLGRFRRPPNQRAASIKSRPIRSFAAAHQVRRGLHSAVQASRLVPVRHHRRTVVQAAAPRVARRSLIARLGPDRAVALAVAGILLGASVVSVSAGVVSVSAGHAAPATGGTTGDGPAPRIAVGGGSVDEHDESDRTGSVEFGQPEAAIPPQSRFAAIGFGDRQIASTQMVDVEGPFSDDGTLLKPIAVDTVVPDGSALVKTYKVKGGDTLVGIAHKFRVSMMSVWWANDLKSKNDLRKGEILRIPPVTGLIVKVTAADTLAAIAARYRVEDTDILATNGLDDPNLVVGQILVVPGAKGKAIAAAKAVARTIARPAAKPVLKPRTRISTASSGGSSRPPSTYAGGKFTWPVVGGGNYISQYFHYGHYAIDIAADYGSKVRAAAGGTVIFAGWKNNGGGYQVWIAHGSGLYTTYNHMSSIAVGSGQHLGRGQQVGRIGQSGNATGPHLHFEVWRGPVWDGGQRVNPLAYF
jgi:murein DD-endopeptidase MepM/ murein hydrolase activator NlpD